MKTYNLEEDYSCYFCGDQDIYIIEKQNEFYSIEDFPFPFESADHFYCTECSPEIYDKCETCNKEINLDNYDLIVKIGEYYYKYGKLPMDLTCVEYYCSEKCKPKLDSKFIKCKSKFIKYKPERKT